MSPKTPKFKDCRTLCTSDRNAERLGDFLRGRDQQSKGPVLEGASGDVAGWRWVGRRTKEPSAKKKRKIFRSPPRKRGRPDEFLVEPDQVQKKTKTKKNRPPPPPCNQSTCPPTSSLQRTHHKPHPGSRKLRPNQQKLNPSSDQDPYLDSQDLDSQPR